MNAHNDNFDASGAILGFFSLLLEFLQLALLAGFILSTWLTRLLFQWVLLPLFPMLEKHDGLVVVISSTLWSGVAGMILFPALVRADLLEVAPGSLVQSWFISLGVGAGWGALVAVWVLVVWWEEIIAHQPPPPAFAKVLDLSPEFYQPEESAVPPRLETLEELENEFLRTAPTASHPEPRVLM